MYNYRDRLFLTLVAKSAGSVLAPVRRLTRKAFQLEYLSCMAKKGIGNRFISDPRTRRNKTKSICYKKYIYINIDILFGGTRGLLLDAHQPTGWISGMPRLHQKSLLVSLSKPSYRSSALNPENKLGI